MSNKAIYQTALEKLDHNNFEKICRKIIEYKWESTGLRFPSEHGGGDGGNDAWDLIHNRKYAVSIMEDWKRKIKDELNKLQKHNRDNPDNPLVEMYYLTNQDIRTAESNKFIAQESTRLQIFALHDLAITCEQYLNNTDDLEFYDLLGIAGIIIPERKSTLYGLPNPDGWNDPEIFDKNFFIKKNDHEFLSFSKPHLADLFFQNIDQNLHSHYLITADAGMGKSFEMQRTVSFIYKNNINRGTHKKVNAYFYDLKTYTGGSPWVDHPAGVQELLYVFLDGWDELSFENQLVLKKLIQENLNKCPHTYFVISGRTGAFSTTTLHEIFNKPIECHFTLWEKIPGWHEDTFPLDLRIPFFRNLYSSMEEGVHPKSVPQLMKIWFENDIQRYRNKFQQRVGLRTLKNYQDILSAIGQFALVLFKENRNTITEKELIESFDENLENILREESWVSADPEKSSTYYFKHKIFQEYLIALYLSKCQKDIPPEFLGGFKKQLIKKEYGNIFYLWLSIISENREENQLLYKNALKLAMFSSNIPFLLSCDYSYIDQVTRKNIIQTVFKKFDEINFTYPDIGKMALLINTLPQENQTLIIKSICKNIKIIIKAGKAQDGKLEVLTTILKNVVKNNINLVNKKHLLSLLHDLFDLYVSGHPKLKTAFSNINTILCVFDSEFKIDVEFKSYYRDDIPTLEKYCSDFEVFCVIEPFMKDQINITFPHYKDNLLSILLKLEVKGFNGMSQLGHTARDDEYTSVLEIGASLKDVYYIAILLETILKQKNISEDLRGLIHTFVLEGFVILFNEHYDKEPHILFDNDLYKFILTKAYEILKYPLSSEQHKNLRTLFLSDKILKMSFSWASYIDNIIDNLSSNSEEKRNWLEGIWFYYIQQSTPYWVDNIIFKILDFTNKAFIEEKLSELDNLKNNAQKDDIRYKFNNVLDRYYHKNNEDISQKWKDKYNTTFEKRDAREHECEKEKQALHEKLNQHKEESEILFNYELFKTELKNILTLKEEWQLNNYHEFTESHLSLQLYPHIDTNSKEYLQFKKILRNFPNQLLVSFLWKRWRDFNKQNFEDLKQSDWERIRLICISDIIGKVADYGDSASFAADSIDLSYFEKRNEKTSNPKKDILRERIEEVIHEECFNYMQDIHEKINILLWLKLNNYDIKLQEECIIPRYLDWPTLKMWGHPLRINPYVPLEIIIGDSTPIIEACKKHILKSEITPDHWYQFYIAYLSQALPENAPDLLQIFTRSKEILNIAIDQNWKSVEAIKVEYIALLDKFQIARSTEKLGIATPEDVYTLFRHRHPLSNDIKQVIKDKFLQEKNETEKYQYGLYVIDADIQVAKWLGEYWLGGGDVPNQFRLSEQYPAVMGAKFECDDSLFELFCKLLTYSCEQEDLSTRREVLLLISQAWITNSIRTEAEFKQLMKTVNNIVSFSTRFKHLKTVWLPDLEARISSLK